MINSQRGASRARGIIVNYTYRVPANIHFLTVGVRNDTLFRYFAMDFFTVRREGKSSILANNCASLYKNSA